MSTEKVIANQQSGLTRLLMRTGQFYIPLAAAIALLPIFPGAAFGLFIIQINAKLTSEQLTSSSWAIAIATLISYAIIISGSVLSTLRANARLKKWSETGLLDNDIDDERVAWRGITYLPWVFTLLTGTSAVLINDIFVVLYQYNVLRVTPDQAIYSFFGNLVPGFATVVLATLFFDGLISPVREILLPRKFEDQMQGRMSALLSQKFIIVGVSLILITVLILAPIGYRQTFTAANEPINQMQFLNELRTELISASILVVVFGFAIILLLSRSVKRPIDSLVQTFALVEQGDLSQRAKVQTTDELGELAIYFNRMLTRLDELQQNLERRVDDRTEQLRASNEVGRIASTILDPDIVINKVVNLITKAFDYYYVAIFIATSNGHWAELKDASGSAGEILKARHHRLQINSKSLVGTAISTREPQVALDVGLSAVRFNNPLLPNTRSEIAIPLTVGDRVIGAMDVQSVREADFKPENIATLQSMANQVAIAIENARIFKEMDQTLEELRLVNREYVVSAWADKLKSNALEYSTRTPDLAEPPNAEFKEIEIGLNLRDERIGQIRLETAGDWNQEDQSWVEALATQVAISLENARLIEESQQSALRERLSASIIQKLWASNSIDSILQTAVRELGRALEASEATIELKVEE
jgi:GAF domain-containing protein/HAMP domain-containing protein